MPDRSKVNLRFLHTAFHQPASVNPRPVYQSSFSSSSSVRSSSANHTPHQKQGEPQRTALSDFTLPRRERARQRARKALLAPGRRRSRRAGRRRSGSAPRHVCSAAVALLGLRDLLELCAAADVGEQAIAPTG